MNKFANEDRAKMQELKSRVNEHEKVIVLYDKFLDGINNAFNVCKKEGVEREALVKILSEILEKRNNYSSWSQFLKEGLGEYSEDEETDSIRTYGMNLSEYTEAVYNGGLNADDMGAEHYESMMSGPDWD